MKSFPSAHSVLLIVVIFAAALTWIIPAGKYDSLGYNKDTHTFAFVGTEGNKTLAGTQQTLDSLGIKIPLEKFTSGDIYKPIGIPSGFHEQKANPQDFFALAQAPILGIGGAFDVILFVLILGGFIGVVHHTGAFDLGVARLATALQGKEKLLIVLITSLIALGGTTFGLAEETIAFYPILMPVFLAAGYDAMVAVACIYIGSCVGTMVSTVNPFSVIIASNAAGINWTSGLWLRLAVLLGCLGISIWFIMRYAERVRKDPSKSIIFSQKEEIEGMFLNKKSNVNEGFSIKTSLILVIFAASFILMIYGVSRLDWWFTEMTTIFFVAALVVGVVASIGEKIFIREFIKGSNDLFSVALTIGLARAVNILMDNGMITDTILHASSGLVNGMSKGVFINAMLFIFGGLSFFIPSSSGMAVLTMPIMSPLADIVGTSREAVVNAYQYGMGIMAIITPTGLVLASLTMVNVSYGKWLRFIMPLVGILTVIAMVVLTLEVYGII